PYHPPNPKPLTHCMREAMGTPTGFSPVGRSLFPFHPPSPTAKPSLLDPERSECARRDKSTRVLRGLIYSHPPNPEPAGTGSFPIGRPFFPGVSRRHLLYRSF